MRDDRASADESWFRLGSGTVVKAGRMRHDLPFLTRSLRFLMMPQGDALRDELDLKPGEITVLGLVAENPGISQNDLASTLVIKKSAVTKVVQGLEATGLIERRRSTSDRRSNELRLTDAGTRKVEQFRAMSVQLHDTWFAGIPAAERERFFSVLFRLVAGLSARGGGGRDAP